MPDEQAFLGGHLLLPSQPVFDVTTVIPVFNGEKYLPATLASVAAQTRLPKKLVIIDDCSSDQTVEVVSKFLGKHPQLNGELRQNEVNKGLFRNLNCCLELASDTDVLHLLLADDLVLPKFLERVVPTLSDADAPSMAWSLTEKIDAFGGLLPGQGAIGARQSRKVSTNELLRRQGQLQTVFCGSILLKTGRRSVPCCFPLDYPQVGDCVFYADWARRANLLVEVPEVLCQIRHHPASATNANASQLGTWVGDELRAMKLIATWMESGRFQRWLWQERIGCLFAARSVVKQQQAKPINIAYSEDISKYAQSLISPLHWSAGRGAVFLRDLLHRSRIL